MSGAGMSAVADNLSIARAEAVFAANPVWLRIAVVAGALAACAVPLTGVSDHVLHLLILIFLYAAMAQSWNVMAGFSGQVSIGHAAFFGIGAYASAALYANAGISPWLGLLTGAAASAAIAALVGVATLRLQGHYFAIATLLVGLSFQIVFARWEWVGAASGLYVPIDRAHPWLSLQFSGSKVPYFYIAMALAGLSVAVVAALDRSAFGFRLKAVRDEPDAAASLGIAVARHKIAAFALSAAMMSVAGSFYAQYVLVLDPERVFSIEISTMVLLITVLGGTGTALGPLVGALILVPLSEYTRVWFGGTGRALDLLLYGVLIMGVCVWRPAGILSLVHQRARRRISP